MHAVRPPLPSWIVGRDCRRCGASGLLHPLLGAAHSANRFAARSSLRQASRSSAIALSIRPSGQPRRRSPEEAGEMLEEDSMTDHAWRLRGSPPLATTARAGTIRTEGLHDRARSSSLVASSGCGSSSRRGHGRPVGRRTAEGGHRPPPAASLAQASAGSGTRPRSRASRTNPGSVHQTASPRSRQTERAALYPPARVPGTPGCTPPPPR
jgi:hypothetical protein